MENKTKEQLAEEYAKKMNGENCSNLFQDLDKTIGEICQEDFIVGWDARQTEIDALKEQIQALTKKDLPLVCIDCGVSNNTVKQRGFCNGIQCYECKKIQDIEDEECR